MAPHDQASVSSRQSIAAQLFRRLQPHKSHEWEDLGNIPGHFFHARLLEIEPLDEDGPFIHGALHTSRSTGKKHLRFCREKKDLYGLQGRLESFLENDDWMGPPGKKMAEAELSRKTSRVAECVFCTMDFRCTSQDFDPLQRHKEMSPYCRYLCMIRQHGTGPRAQSGGKLRRHSCTSIDILTSERESMI